MEVSTSVTLYPLGWVVIYVLSIKARDKEGGGTDKGVRGSKRTRHGHWLAPRIEDGTCEDNEENKQRNRANRQSTDASCIDAK